MGTTLRKIPLKKSEYVIAILTQIHNFVLLIVHKSPFLFLSCITILRPGLVSYSFFYHHQQAENYTVNSLSIILPITTYLKTVNRSLFALDIEGLKGSYENN
jgi:hypothetical protein